MTTFRTTLMIASAVALLSSASVLADKGSNPFTITAAGGINILAEDLPRGGPLPPTDTILSFETPQGNIQSGGVAGSADNCVVNLSLPVGTEITGLSWDARVETIGPSWLSEVQAQFRTTDPADPQVNLTFAPGMANNVPGTIDTSSGGLLILADVAIPNIPVGADGVFRMEIVDLFDDGPGPDADLFNLPVGSDLGITLQCDDQAACDAAVTDASTIFGTGTCAAFDFAVQGVVLPESQPVPVNNPAFLALLIALMAGLGVFAVRRFA